MANVTFVTPTAGLPVTHVVIARGRGYLFAEYNHAYAFRDMLIKWLGYAEDDVDLIPLAVTGPEDR